MEGRIEAMAQTKGGHKAEDGSGWIDSKEWVSGKQKDVEKGSKHFRDQVSNVKQLANVNKNDFLMIIGCFTGKYNCIFSRTCKTVGVDINRFALDVAEDYCKRKGNPKNCSFFLREKPLDEMFKGKTFTKVLMIDTTEHMLNEELEKTLSEIKPIMGMKSELVIYTPNRGHWSEWLRAIGISRIGGHINLKKPSELKEFVEQNGFFVKEFYLKPSTTPLAAIEKMLPLQFLKKRICLKAVKKR